MSEEDFAELGETNCQYLVGYNGNDDTDFRRAANEKYHIHSYTAAEENQRIVMVRSQAEMFLIMSWMLLCILPLVAVALICIIISRKVKTEQQMIGTLSAMGYTRAQLARICSHSRHYRRRPDFCDYGGCRPAIRGTGAY